MTRRDAIIHGRALLRHLTEAGAAPGWCAALRALIQSAETVDRAQQRRLRSTPPGALAAGGARGATARWATLSPAERSAEMSRRRRKGLKQQKKRPPAE